MASRADSVTGGSGAVSGNAALSGMHGPCEVDMVRPFGGLFARLCASGGRGGSAERSAAGAADGGIPGDRRGGAPTHRRRPTIDRRGRVGADGAGKERMAHTESANGARQLIAGELETHSGGERGRSDHARQPYEPLR
ncbi:hypothetical protein GCM10010341_11010 [Streptomyces noursei]|nr:hypothetical protein GCM10010341_11010 [Streptomyces noursei]